MLNAEKGSPSRKTLNTISEFVGRELSGDTQGLPNIYTTTRGKTFRQKLPMMAAAPPPMEWPSSTRRYPSFVESSASTSSLVSRAISRAEWTMP
mmetsp:Transcript_31911/g.36869  ORF Transcript_31911/g.36869 Transcript_31911/m.36869 type:complete len:94 (+) Transcript_31911:448-729(+)